MKLFGIIIGSDGFTGTIWPGCKGVIIGGGDCKGIILTGGECKGLMTTGGD